MSADDPRFVLILTPSQRMALLDVITASMVGPVRCEVYVDVVRGVETTPEDLLAVVLNAPAIDRDTLAADEAYSALARRVCHEFGLPWTDPRTGITYPPPGDTTP